MSTYIDYYIDHDLDTTSIKNFLIDLEKHLGYKPRWGSDVPENEKRNGFYLGWEHWCHKVKDDDIDDPYDENKHQDISNVSLFYYEDGYIILEAIVHHGVFDIWVKDDELRFPYHFKWLWFLRIFLGSKNNDVKEEETIEIRNETYEILKKYKMIFAPFHCTTFLAEGEEYNWVEHAESGECTIDGLLNFSIISCGNDYGKPVAFNARSTFDYDSCDDILVFIEKFENV